MSRRNYSSTAQRTTLSAGCTDVATTMTVTAVTGWPASTPYALIIDPDTVNEEIVLVTNRAGLTLTVTRAQGGTTGVAHSSGAVVQHGVYAQDFEDPNAFLNNAAAAPGPIQFSAGTVSLPAITTSGDPNTGIYFSAADSVSIATGGVQRLNVDANGLLTGTGTSLGAWTSYTPTLGGSGWAIGNGNVTGSKYCRIGKTVDFAAFVSFGTTSTFGAGQLTLSLPFAASGTVIVRGWAYTAANARYSIAGVAAASTISLNSEASPWASVTSTVPFAFASSTGIALSGTFEAA